MNYTDQWKALSSRIQGLVQSGLLHAQYLRVRSSDSYGTGKRLREQSESVLNEILSFREGFQVSLPFTALSAIDKFATTTGKLITDTSGPPDAAQERVWAGLVALAAFEAELSFLLSDTQESIRTRSERGVAPQLVPDSEGIADDRCSKLRRPRAACAVPRDTSVPGTRQSASVWSGTEFQGEDGSA